MSTWLSPVILAVLAARIVAGDASAPTLVAIVVGAGLVSLLVAGRVVLTPSRATTVPLLVALVLVLAANLVVLGDLSRLLGFTHEAGIGAGVALALGAGGWAALDRWGRVVTPLGVVLVVRPLGRVVAAAGPPWTAWQVVASRAAMTFGQGSAWVTHGGALGDRARLTFREPHRVEAASAATWRVVERDASHVAVREWRLGAGEALTLRPGDELAVDPGALVRFEAGRRVPGAPPSGMVWADGRPRKLQEAFVAVGGTALTLVVGGLALTPAVPVAGITTIVAPTVLLAFAVGGSLWGLYGVALAPELSLVPRAFAPVLEVVTRVGSSRWHDTLIALVVTGVLVLFVGLAVTWRARLALAFAELAGAFQRPALSRLALFAAAAVVVGLAGALAVRGGDPWALLMWGLGLAAATTVAPRLAAAGPRGELFGTVVGAATFVVVLFGGDRLPPLLAAVVDYPALAAAPLAWLAARATRQPS